MSTTHPDHDFAEEVGELRRQLGRLLRRLHRCADPDADLSIAQWCAKHGLSRAGFYRLEKEGRGPEVIRTGGVVRITAAADAEWTRRWSSASIIQEESSQT